MESNIVIKNRFFDTSANTQVKDEEGKNRTLLDYIDYLSRKEACDRTNLEKIFVDDVILNFQGSKNESSFFNEFGDVLTSNIKSDVATVMKRGGLVWDMVISLKDKEYAKINNLETKNDFKEYAKECLNELFSKERFNPAYTKWSGVLHTNTAHPHMHIIFYEKNKPYYRKKGVIKQKHINSMKLKLDSILIKDYSEFIDERDIKNIMQNNLISDVINIKEVDLKIEKLYKNLLLSFPNRKIDFNGEEFKAYKKDIERLIKIGLAVPEISEKNEQINKQFKKLEDYLETFLPGTDYSKNQNDFLMNRMSRVIVKELMNDRKSNRINEMNTKRLLRISNHALNDIQFELDRASSKFLNQR